MSGFLRQLRNSSGRRSSHMNDEPTWRFRHVPQSPFAPSAPQPRARLRAHCRAGGARARRRSGVGPVQHRRRRQRRQRRADVPADGRLRSVRQPAHPHAPRARPRVVDPRRPAGPGRPDRQRSVRAQPAGAGGHRGPRPHRRPAQLRHLHGHRDLPEPGPAHPRLRPGRRRRRRQRRVQAVRRPRRERRRAEVLGQPGRHPGRHPLRRVDAGAGHAG